MVSMPSCRACMTLTAAGPLTDGAATIAMPLPAFEVAAASGRESLLMFAEALLAWLVCGPPQAASNVQAAAVITMRMNILLLLIGRLASGADHPDDSREILRAAPRVDEALVQLLGFGTHGSVRADALRRIGCKLQILEHE